jgi:hypothetical protein
MFALSSGVAMLGRSAKNMNLFVAIIQPLLLAFLVGLFLSYTVFLYRKHTIKSEKKIISFLDKRFEVINTQGLWSKNKRADYIDNKSIRKWGNSGWAFLGLAAISIELPPEKIIGIGNILAFLLLLFTGLILGDSRSASFFLQKMNCSQYKPAK